LGAIEVESKELRKAIDDMKYLCELKEKKEQYIADMAAQETRIN